MVYFPVNPHTQVLWTGCILLVLAVLQHILLSDKPSGRDGCKNMGAVATSSVTSLSPRVYILYLAYAWYMHIISENYCSTIFHQPGFPCNMGISLTKLPFKVTRYNLSRYIASVYVRMCAYNTPQDFTYCTSPFRNPIIPNSCKAFTAASCNPPRSLLTIMVAKACNSWMPLRPGKNPETSPPVI